MRVFLIGSTGRDHALAWKLAASPLLSRLYAAPGNPGIGEQAELVSVDVMDKEAVLAFCKENKIDLVVIGPSGPLLAGLTDYLEAAGIRVFGPSAAAAQLEGSKTFTKRLCAANNIPAASFAEFRERETARRYVLEREPPIILKIETPHAGKGVIVARTVDEAYSKVGISASSVLLTVRQ
jgi:phosphoribosylamine--glycine ligase